MSITKQELQRFLAGYREEIRESAAGLLGEEMPLLRAEDFDLYEKNGNRLVYEAAYFSRRKFLAILGMEAVLEAEETNIVEDVVLRKLCDVLDKICAETTWALPAHVSRQGNDTWRETVDLFASETAQTLSELLDRLQEFLPEYLKARMGREMNRRVLGPYFLSKPPYASWESAGSNWAAVCAGSIGSACIHLAKAGRRLPQPLTDCLSRVRAVLPYYFQSFTDDGACMEGLQYYTYGMTYFANFAWELRDLTGENLFDRPDIAAFPAKCFFKDGVSLSFSDGSKNDTFRVGLQALQALMYRETQCRFMPGEAKGQLIHGETEGEPAREETFFPPMERAAHLHSDICYRFAGLKLDWFATKEYLERIDDTAEELKPEPSCWFHILPSAQWCVGCARDGTGFACKGGHNGESHNHNDIGHFIYEAGGVLFLTDLGAGEYTKEYFSAGRYHEICNNSFGHSVPILNGLGQSAGEAYRCTAFSVSAGEASGAGTEVIRMKCGSAYSLSEDGTPLDGEAFRREMHFDLETGELSVMDFFQLPAFANVTENLVTQILPVVDGNRICLEQNGLKVVIEFALMPGMPPPEITVLTYAHSNHQGDGEIVYSIRRDVPMREKKGVSRFTVRRIKTQKAAGR